MASKRHLKLTNFGGVNRAVSERDDTTFLKTCVNFDTNVEAGKLVSRKGYASKVDLAAANIDQIFEYRDEEWGKDVLLVYDKNATVGSRKIYVYTRTSGSGSTYAQAGSYDYGSLEFGDRLGFLAYRGGVRIGTGTGATNKALTGKYYDRTGDNAMFDGNISFSGFFLHKQQWVQQPEQFSHLRDIIYDSTRERYYCFTNRGVEIRTTDWRIERILDDVRTYPQQENSGSATPLGGLAMSGTSLYAGGIEFGTDNNFKVFRYNLANDYAVLNTADYTTKDIYDICTNGTNVWVVYLDTVAKLDELGMDLSNSTVPAHSFTPALAIYAITVMGNFVYAMDSANNQIVQLDYTSSYTAVNYSPSVTGNYWDIDNDGTDLYYLIDNITNSVVYKTTPAGTFSSSTKTLMATISGDIATSLNLLGDIPAVFNFDLGQVLLYDDKSTFALNNYLPGKISLALFNTDTTTGAANTFFYGVSLVFEDGQESHLNSSLQIVDNDGDLRTFKVVVNADAVTYSGDESSPLSDPAETNSIWNEFRGLKKIRIWRASSASVSSEPTSNYLLLKEIEIDDARWDEHTSEKIYTYTINDPVGIGELSSVSFESSTGLPETFKPYYVNWQYAKQMGQFFYYGNVFTDDLYPQRVIESSLLAPDMIYPTDTNFADFGLGDGDAIQGLETSWNRIAVFKGEKIGIFNGLNQEIIYQIGTNSPDSIVAWNNYVYFTYGSSIYQINPSGFERISKPVDELLAGETMTGTVAAVFKDKEKIWFLIPGNTSYLFNYVLGTWDVYEINNGDDSHVYIVTASDGNILTANSNDDKVYIQNSGTQDNGQNIALSFETNELPVGAGFMNANIYRMFVTLISAADLTVQLAYRNENGAKTVSKSFPLSATNVTRQRFLNGVYGQLCSFAMASYSSSSEVRIDDLGIEYSVTADRLQNA